jgi:ketosteroid isomerase-like protein
MNYRHTISISILTLILGTGCTSNGTPHSSIDSQAATNTLRRLDDEWSAAAQKRDVEKVASFYADDAIAYPPGEPVARGKAAAKKVWAAYLADPSFKISWKANDAHVCADGKLGFTSGTYDASYNGADGKPVAEKGKFLCVWQKQPDGSWKAIRDMWNTDTK